MKAKFLLFIIIILALSLSGCTNKTVITQSNNGEEIELQKGQTLEVRLDGNITTGYSWEILENNEALLQQKGDREYKESNTDSVGAGGTFVFTFEAKDSGSATLKLGYMRPWEENVDPVDTFEIMVVIK